MEAGEHRGDDDNMVWMDGRMLMSCVLYGDEVDHRHSLGAFPAVITIITIVRTDVCLPNPIHPSIHPYGSSHDTNDTPSPQHSPHSHRITSHPQTFFFPSPMLTATTSDSATCSGACGPSLPGVYSTLPCDDLRQPCSECDDHKERGM